MSAVERRARSFFEDCCEPVRKDEIVHPTRVVWRVCGTVTTRLFPTKQRAWDFATTVDNLIDVHDVDDEVPKQSDARMAANVKFKWRKNVRRRTQ